MGDALRIAAMTCGVLAAMAAFAGWTDSTFEEFVDGTFDDGGASGTCSAERATKLMSRSSARYQAKDAQPPDSWTDGCARNGYDTVVIRSR